MPAHLRISDVFVRVILLCIAVTHVAKQFMVNTEFQFWCEVQFASLIQVNVLQFRDGQIISAFALHVCASCWILALFFFSLSICTI